MLVQTPTVLDYYSDSPTFALAFSPLGSSTSSLKLAVGSYNEARGTDANHLTIAAVDTAVLELEDDDSDDDDNHDGRNIEGSYAKTADGQRIRIGSAFTNVARASHPYPPSAVRFSPPKLSATIQAAAAGTTGEITREMVATSSDCLRLWDLVQDDSGPSAASKAKFVGQADVSTGHKLVQRAALANSKAEFSAPLTSFSWSALEPTHIVTSSIDTTCTVWDISNGTPVTQLIAHDREVYDVAWSPASKDIFASVGADGSVRMFDLRSLEHSTILYEATAPVPAASNGSTSGSKNNGVNPSSPNPSTSSKSGSSATQPSPLLRLAFSPHAPSYLSVCHADSSDVQILDIRSPGVPVLELKAHQGAVNGIAWGGSTLAGGGGGDGGPGSLATCSDDCTLLLWDLSSNVATPQQSGSSGSRAQPAQAKTISNPAMAYSAPSEVNAVACSVGGDWVAAGCGKLVRCLRPFSEGCPIYSPFFGAMGCTAAIVFTCIGASYGTSKSGVGIAAMGVLRPDLMMKCIIPVVMAGIIAIYGLVVSVLISGEIKSPMALYTGFVQLGAGLSVGLAGLSAGFAIGIVGDAGVRGVAQQSRVFVGMVLILIFAEVLGLYGLIVALILNSRASEHPEC
ncbi:hypothetical protein ACM66B_005324 [Microbotryomycetes sp. NB124-2]